jgi:hypothetical protein
MKEKSINKNISIGTKVHIIGPIFKSDPTFPKSSINKSGEITGITIEKLITPVTVFIIKIDNGKNKEPCTYRFWREEFTELLI